MQLQTKNQKYTICLLVSVVSFFASALILRNGIRAWPDAWSYWEGSVSLIETHSYTYLSGSPIVYWPPLFSGFLACFQVIFSQTGYALVLAMSTCSGLAAFVWSLYVCIIFNEEGKINLSSAFLANMIFVPLFVPLCCLSLSSNSLNLFFLGLLFYVIADRSDNKASSNRFQNTIFLGLILCACMLTHNSCVVFVMATVIAVLFLTNSAVSRRITDSILILLVSIIPWILIRHHLGQTGSHQFVGGVLSVFDYIKQVPCSIGVFFVSTSSVLIQSLVGILILAGLVLMLAQRAQSAAEMRCRLCINLSLVVFGGFFVLVNLTLVPDGLGGRYIYYFPLAIAPLLFFRLKANNSLVVVLIFLTVGVSGARISQRIWRGSIPPLDNHMKNQSTQMIHSEYFLTSKKDAPIPSGTIRIKPPVYSWGDHWFRNKPWTETGIWVELIDTETNVFH